MVFATSPSSYSTLDYKNLLPQAAMKVIYSVRRTRVVRTCACVFATGISFIYYRKYFAEAASRTFYSSDRTSLQHVAHPNWQAVWFGLTDRLQKEFKEDNTESLARRTSTRLPLVPLSDGAAMQISIPFAGDALIVPGIATADWWAGVTSRSWEPSTWRAFNQEIHTKGVYIGFGEWCGVTGLFAAMRSKKTILMEPDPFIFNRNGAKCASERPCARQPSVRRSKMYIRCLQDL